MSENETILLDLPASHKYLNVLAACLTATLERYEWPALSPSALPKIDVGGLPYQARATHDISLAAHEVCANIIDHAYAGQTDGRIQVRLTLEQSHRRLVIELGDVGQSFDPSLVPEPDLEHGQVHGYGLFLVHQLLDEVVYEAQPDGNCWRLVKNL